MTMQIVGIDDVKKILNDIAPKHSKNLMRATVQGIASEMAKEAKKNAPRDEGTLKRAIKAKRKRSHSLQPISEVIVTHGRSVRFDAFYWRFLEYGTQKISAQPFIKPAEEKVGGEMDRHIVELFGKKLESKLKRERNKQDKA